MLVFTLIVPVSFTPRLEIVLPLEAHPDEESPVSKEVVTDVTNVKSSIKLPTFVTSTSNEIDSPGLAWNVCPSA